MMVDNRPPFRGLQTVDFLQTFNGLSTPCYILDESMLKANGRILKQLADKTGCKVLLAQKAFSNYDMYPVLEPYLAGTEASGLFEARLGAEEMPDKEVHVFAAAYRDDEFDELLKYADHIVFNSPNQLRRFGRKAKLAGKEIGLRINPECSTQEGHEIYDPCAKGSRLGTTRVQWDLEMTDELINLLDGLHFHTLCEQNADALKITLDAVECKFGDILSKMKWLNMGGGHHITRDDYDIELLEELIIKVRNKWKLDIYLEPGEACALNSGYLLTRVLDIIENGNTSIAILDMSAACHTPDVIEMPYRPPLYGAKDDADGSSFVYRLGGPTCLAGDIIGDYAFSEKLRPNDMLIFGDMAIYSTCKNNTFNGMPLPSILRMREDGSVETIKEFNYNDFKYRLGQ